MIDEFKGLTKDYIEAIIMLLTDKDNLKDIEKINSNINAMCEGIAHCPDRQIAELKFCYNVLKGEAKTDEDLDTMMENLIAVQKENIFDSIVTPKAASQNVHVLNFWKNKLKDKLGFNFEFKSRLGTLGQDQFFGEPGNVLDAFYNEFTPEKVIKILTIEINKKPKLLSAMSSFADNLAGKDDEKRKRMLEYADEELCIPIAVKTEAVKTFLINRGILIENSE